MAVLIGLYTLAMLAGMYRYGIERWLDSGEMFTVYTGTMATLSAIEVRDTDDGRRLGFRPPIVGVTRIPWAPARVAFVAALIGTVTFDGLSGSDFWATRDVTAAERLIERGIDDFTAGIIVATIGLLVTLGRHRRALRGRVTRLGPARGLDAAASQCPDGGGVRACADPDRARVLRRALLHAVRVPVPGHHPSRLRPVRDRRGLVRHRRSSDRLPARVGQPDLGRAGHGDRHRPRRRPGARARSSTRARADPRLALRSQYPMLVLMVILTVSGLWSLSEGMATV